MAYIISSRPLQPSLLFNPAESLLKVFLPVFRGTAGQFYHLYFGRFPEFEFLPAVWTAYIVALYGHPAFLVRAPPFVESLAMNEFVSHKFRGLTDYSHFIPRFLFFFDAPYYPFHNVRQITEQSVPGHVTVHVAAAGMTFSFTAPYFPGHGTSFTVTVLHCPFPPPFFPALPLPAPWWGKRFFRTPRTECAACQNTLT